MKRNPELVKLTPDGEARVRAIMTGALLHLREALAEEERWHEGNISATQLRVKQLEGALREVMRVLDNPLNATHAELTRLNVEAWKCARAALAGKGEP